MKNHSETGLDVRKKARKFMLLGILTTPLIITIYHNFFSEEISKIDFFGVFVAR